MDTHNNSQEKVVDADGSDEGWVDTHHYSEAGGGDLTNQVSEMTLETVSCLALVLYVIYLYTCSIYIPVLFI